MCNSPSNLIPVVTKIADDVFDGTLRERKMDTDGGIRNVGAAVLVSRDEGDTEDKSDLR